MGTIRCWELVETARTRSFEDYRGVRGFIKASPPLNFQSSLNHILGCVHRCHVGFVRP